jgi:hypothetical protein
MAPRVFLIPALLVTSLYAGASAAKPQDYTQKIEGSLVTFDMVAIPGGTLELAVGDESPRSARVQRF